MRGGERVASHQKAPARTALSFMLLDRDHVVRDGPRLVLNKGAGLQTVLEMDLEGA